MVCEDFNVYLESEEEEEEKKPHTLVWNAIYNHQDMKRYIYMRIKQQVWISFIDTLSLL